jgi:integrase
MGKMMGAIVIDIEKQDGETALAKTPGKSKGRHPENRLTTPAIKVAQPGRHADGGGLYLEVDANGAKRWFLRTTVRGRRKDIGLGGLSYVGLAEAREKARALRKVARDGGDPVAERDKDKRRSITFEEAARKVHAEHIEPVNRNAKANAQWLSTLEAYVIPKMGKRPVFAIDQADVLRALGPIWIEKPETARRVKQRIRTVLDWSRANGMGDGAHPVDGIEKALPRQSNRDKHHAALPYAELPALWPRLEAVNGMGALALRFTILTAARSGEARGATWDEIDLDARTWSIPAERMKAAKDHRVPLSDAAVMVLRQAKAAALRDDETLVFPSTKPGKPISDMTLSAVLKRLDVSVTVHGFRSTFRDWTEESTNFPHEVKEAALAHAVRNAVERAYRRTDLFEKRRAMMETWAAFATQPCGNVVRIGV